MRWWPNLVSSQEELLQRKNFVKKQFIFDSLFRGQTLHKHYPQLNCKLRLKPGPKTTILYLVIRQPALVALKKSKLKSHIYKLFKDNISRHRSDRYIYLCTRHTKSSDRRKKMVAPCNINVIHVLFLSLVNVYG